MTFLRFQRNPTSDQTQLHALAATVYRSLPLTLRYEIDAFVHGVLGGRAQPLEDHTEELYRAYAPVRAFLRTHDTTIKLYRGEPKNKPQLLRRFLSWTPYRRLAARFAESENYEIIEADVKVSHVVAVLTSPENASYIEFLVRDRKQYHVFGKQLPWLGWVVVEFPYRWGKPKVEHFTRAWAENVAADVRSAVEARGARVVSTKINEEYENVVVAVEVPPEMKTGIGDSVMIGPYKVETLHIYSGTR